MPVPDDASDFEDLDLSPDEFRDLGYHVIDMIADYFATVRDLPVFPKETSEDVALVFDEPLPERGQDPRAVVDEWRSKILPHATHLGSPRYFGFVNGSSTMIGTLADALAAAVNMNPGSWKAAPAATEIERRSIAWLAELIGYPTDCGGQLTSGGTMANFTALLTALRNKASYDTTAEGLQRDGHDGRFTMYMSDHEGHISITRVADLMNLGRESVRRVSSREDFTIDPAALERMLDEDMARGDVPFCVIAQVGSINVGAIDPLEDLAAICRARDLWLHADGACGAVGAMLPEKRALYAGLELADSVTLDPHKWLYIPYECGAVLVRNQEALRRAYSLSAPYLRGTLPTDHAGLDYFEHGPQMSRGFRALKLWMTLKHFGAEGYRKLLRQNLQCAERLDVLVRESPNFRSLHPPTLFIYSFQYVPQDVGEHDGSDPAQSQIDEYLDGLNQRIADEIQLSGVAFIMTSRVRGRTVLRVSISSHRTTLEDIDLVFATLRDIGARLHRGQAVLAGAGGRE